MGSAKCGSKIRTMCSWMPRSATSSARSKGFRRESSSCLGPLRRKRSYLLRGGRRLQGNVRQSASDGWLLGRLDTWVSALRLRKALKQLRRSVFQRNISSRTMRGTRREQAMEGLFFQMARLAGAVGLALLTDLILHNLLIPKKPTTRGCPKNVEARYIAGTQTSQLDGQLGSL
jgi:hypothetical protein